MKADASSIAMSAGALVATHLLKRSTEDVDCTLTERRAQFPYWQGRFLIGGGSTSEHAGEIAVCFVPLLVCCW
jgi:hypothetical protein